MILILYSYLQTKSPIQTQMVLNYTRFYIRDFEFRKAIDPDQFQAIITINHRILVPSCNLIQLFRDDNDRFTRYMVATYKVFIHFEEHRGRIKIVNNTALTFTKDLHRMEAAVEAIIERFHKDMDYLHRKNKLPSTNRQRVPPPAPPPVPPPTSPAPPAPPSSVFPNLPPFPAQPPALAQLPPQVPPQSTADPVPPIQGAAGLVAVIYAPTPEVLSKLFLNNINYTLAPEFLVRQMLFPTLPPAILEEGQIL